MAFEVIGVLCAAGIQGIMITIVNPSSNCDRSTLALNKITLMNDLSNFSTHIPFEAVDTSTKNPDTTNALVFIEPSSFENAYE